MAGYSIVSHVATHPHEVRANIMFGRHQDRPYWAFRKLMSSLEGDFQHTVEIDDEAWEVTLGYDVSGIAPRPQDSVQKLYEYTLSAQGDGRRKISARLQPRFEAENMTKYNPSGEEIVRDDEGDRAQIQGIPQDLGRAVNWRVNPAVNIEPDDIPRLLSKLVKAVANTTSHRWDPSFFSQGVHPYSSIWEYERYVRIRRDAASKLVRADGTFNRIRQLLADERGTKMNVSIDNTGKNQEIVGYNHQYRLNDTAASKLFPTGKQRGKQLKHYHPEYVNSDDEDPLYHPKFGVLFKRSWSDGALSWHDHQDMTHELEETLLNVLSWSDIPTRAGAPTFVPDDHFVNKKSELDISWFDDPTPTIESRQDSLFVTKFRELTDSDENLLQQLVADGGEADYSELADEADISISTLYRALEKLDGLLKSDNGTVSFISDYVRQQYEKIYEHVEETVSAAAEAAGRVLDMDPRRIEEQGAAWQRWLNTYAVDVRETDDNQLKLKVNTILSRFRSTTDPFVSEVLEFGAICWRKAGRDTALEFDNILVEYESESGTTIERAGTAMTAY